MKASSSRHLLDSVYRHEKTHIQIGAPLIVFTAKSQDLCPELMSFGSTKGQIPADRRLTSNYSTKPVFTSGPP